MLNVAPWQVDKTIALLDEGNTVPFIARYRKEATGTLDEEQIRSIVTELERLRKVDDRRATIIASVQEQEKLTDALHKQLQAAVTLTELDDLYQPYRPIPVNGRSVLAEHRPAALRMLTTPKVSLTTITILSCV